MNTFAATKSWFLEGSRRASLSLVLVMIGCGGGAAEGSAASTQAVTDDAPFVRGRTYTGTALTSITFGQDGTYTTRGEESSSSGTYTQIGSTLDLVQSDGAKWRLTVSVDGETLSRYGDVSYRLGADAASSVTGRMYAGTALTTIAFAFDGTYDAGDEEGSSSGTYEQSGATLDLVQSDGVEWQLTVSADGKSLSRDGEVVYTRP